jgi:hypothetical protein
MFHLIGKTLAVLATIGVVAKIAELEEESKVAKRRRQFETDLLRKEKISNRDLATHRKKTLENSIKRQKLKEAEINRILYGIPVEVPIPDRESSWWRFWRSNHDLNLQPPTSSENEAELKVQEAFRAQYPFTTVKVPSRYMDEFVKEIDWLHSKTGQVPNTTDQRAILIGIISNS